MKFGLMDLGLGLLRPSSEIVAGQHGLTTARLTSHPAHAAQETP